MTFLLEKEVANLQPLILTFYRYVVAVLYKKLYVYVYKMFLNSQTPLSCKAATVL